MNIFVWLAIVGVIGFFIGMIVPFPLSILVCFVFGSVSTIFAMDRDWIE